MNDGFDAVDDPEADNAQNERGVARTALAQVAKRDSAAAELLACTVAGDQPGGESRAAGLQQNGGVPLAQLDMTPDVPV